MGHKTTKDKAELPRLSSTFAKFITWKAVDQDTSFLDHIEVFSLGVIKHSADHNHYLTLLQKNSLAEETNAFSFFSKLEKF